MKTEDQLANILTKALGRVKFVKLSTRIGLKKAWDEKKIKLEKVGSDFPFRSKIGACGTTMARRGEH